MYFHDFSGNAAYQSIFGDQRPDYIREIQRRDREESAKAAAAYERDQELSLFMDRFEAERQVNERQEALEREAFIAGQEYDAERVRLLDEEQEERERIAAERERVAAELDDERGPRRVDLFLYSPPARSWVQFFEGNRVDMHGLSLPIPGFDSLAELAHRLSESGEDRYTDEMTRELSTNAYVLQVQYESSPTLYFPVHHAELLATSMMSGDVLQSIANIVEEGNSQTEYLLDGIYIPIRVELQLIRHKRVVNLGSSQSRSRSRSRSSGRGKGKAVTARSQLRVTQASKVVSEPYYRNSSTVGFFPYVNSSNIDLEYAQIFAEARRERNVEHCLISTLRYFGVKDHILSDIALRLVGHTFHVPRKDFKIVCELANVSFELTMFNNNTDMKRRSFKVACKSPNDATISIIAGLFMDHIFPNVATQFSMFFIRNLKKIYALSDAQCDGRALKIIKFRRDKPVFGDPRGMDTLGVIRELFIGGFFHQCSQIERVIMPESPVLSELSLTNEQVEYEQKNADEPSSTIFFAADLESFTEGKHTCCLAAACLVPSPDSKVDERLVQHVATFSGEDPIHELFTFIAAKIRKEESRRRIKYKKRVVFFHNLRYDRTLFETHPSVFLQSIITKDNNIYALVVRCMDAILEVRDSLKMIPIGISKFSKTFRLPVGLHKKENLILYDYFKRENFFNRFRCSVEEYSAEHKFAEGEVEREEFVKELLVHLPTIAEVKFDPETQTFYPKALYIYYLKYDVAVLAGGLCTFRKEFNELTNGEMDVLDSLTISSYAYRHMGLYGAFEGAYCVSGNLRAFLSEAIYGGRVLCNPLYEGTIVSDTELDYFDACSLYPSAIKYICQEKGGFPVGPARLLTDELKDYIELCAVASEFTVRIRITKIVRRQFSIPFIAYRNNGRLDYIQDMPEGLDHFSVTVDKQTLEDYLLYHEIQFDILEGVYWTGELNTQWGDIVERLYSARLAAKAEGKNVKADCIKLILNSAYGKTITRASNTRVSYIPKTKNGVAKNWQLSISNAFNVIQKYREVGVNQVEVSKYELDKSSNISKYGSMILAASKHIMNEVFDLMSVNEMPIYYTDTDSFVMRKSDRIPLAVKFREKFDRNLIGKELGNFHSDFSFKLDGRDVDPELVTSIEFIPAGRKLYLHHLVATVDGKTHHSLQFKAKGCTVEGMWDAAGRIAPGDAGMIELYRRLTYGEKIKITLNPVGKKVKFVYSKDNSVSTPDVRFVREICSQAARKVKLGKDEPIEPSSSDVDDE